MPYFVNKLSKIAKKRLKLRFSTFLFICSVIYCVENTQIITSKQGELSLINISITTLLPVRSFTVYYSHIYINIMSGDVGIIFLLTLQQCMVPCGNKMIIKTIVTVVLDMRRFYRIILTPVATTFHKGIKCFNRTHYTIDRWKIPIY